MASHFWMVMRHSLMPMILIAFDFMSNKSPMCMHIWHQFHMFYWLAPPPDIQ